MAKTEGKTGDNLTAAAMGSAQGEEAPKYLTSLISITGKKVKYPMGKDLFLPTLSHGFAPVF